MKSNSPQNVFKVIFENGNSLTTPMNATLTEAREYYIGQKFEFDEMKPSVKAVSVEQINDKSE